MKQKINFSLIQADLIWEDMPVNLKKFDRLLTQIPAETEIVILPEMFSTAFTMNVYNLPESVGQETLGWMQQKAKELNKIIIGSTLFEEKAKYYNRMFWMRPDGSYEFYNKRHLFHQGGEDKVMTAGQRKTIVEFKGVRFLLLICYDLRFPVWSKNNYDKKTDKYDYDAIIYIANWPESRKQAYLTLLKARAVENQAEIFWVNRVGKDVKEIEYSGDSQILDAYGNVEVKAIPGKEMILNYEVDFSKVYSLRESFKVGLDWDKFKIL